jgi:hypothetical protein
LAIRRRPWHHNSSIEEVSTETPVSSKKPFEIAFTSYMNRFLPFSWFTSSGGPESDDITRPPAGALAAASDPTTVSDLSLAGDLDGYLQSKKIDPKHLELYEAEVLRVESVLAERRNELLAEIAATKLETANDPCSQKKKLDLKNLESNLGRLEEAMKGDWTRKLRLANRIQDENVRGFLLETKRSRLIDDVVAGSRESGVLASAENGNGASDNSALAVTDVSTTWK